VINNLLTIKADGGTNIGAVMEEVMKIDRPDNVYLIVSDGITKADKGLTKKFTQKYGAKTRLILIPPSSEDYRWIKDLKKRNNVVYARDVVQFEKGVRKLLIFCGIMIQISGGGFMRWLGFKGVPGLKKGVFLRFFRRSLSASACRFWPFRRGTALRPP